MYNSILVLHLHPQYGRSIVYVPIKFDNAKIAQLVERDLAKVEVAGSSPVFRSTNYNFYSFNKLKSIRSDGEIGRHAGLKIQ